MTETKARRRIREAVESRGHSVEEMTWEPIYYEGEKSGMGGGWWITLTEGYGHNGQYDDLYGLSVEEVLASVDYSLRPSGACDCDQGMRPGSDIPRHPLIRLKGQPEKPLHEPSCKWYIAYRLRWWPS